MAMREAFAVGFKYFVFGVAIFVAFYGHGLLGL